MLSQTCLTKCCSYRQWIKNYEEILKEGKKRMQKAFDMKLMILKLENLEWENKKLKQKFKISDDDPIFKKENPERIITIRKKKKTLEKRE